MKHLKFIPLLTLLLLAGCSSTDKVIVPDVPPSELYTKAQVELQNGNWSEAVTQLEALDSRYPFGPYANQVQLDLIYAYYKSDELALGQATIDRFIRLNPTHEQLDWVLYMRGLTSMAQDRNFLHDLFRIDRSDRDPEPARAAFNDFKRLQKRFPDSPYGADAKLRMIFLKNRLADYDLATAQFYIKRGAWIAAIDRAEKIQRDFPDTQAARKSLLVMERGYKELNLTKPLAHTKELMQLNSVK
ncbi:outer membrane protein assembly factor BamD [Vibrio sp. SS-MA-C1-2]|uniref:outer membrane protein assembly factor BamD n=1 Tax=Vibrio sp. SS-MA-C1-2 TaxID=2908646 RepID=UPI001F2FFB49|nr:outer membrane protein assembly factor BamD [Vibrio sp. SS-MA-C1-2]UJF20063.1 outer membrane protein assembly factor BamD [Vibrio sp. SS-MA-C1-2]